MSELLAGLHEFTASLSPVLKWVAVMLAGALPFVESYFGSVIGVVAGVAPVSAVSEAVIGNIGSTLATVAVTSTLQERRAGAPERSFRHQRLRRVLGRYGVPGVSLVGPTVLASQITAATLVALGAPIRAVLLWQVIAITAWGILYGTLATLGVGLLT